MARSRTRFERERALLPLATVACDAYESVLRVTTTPALDPWLQVNPEEERLARWTTCQLSGMALAPPCVADELGNLFNKDAVLQVGVASVVMVDHCRAKLSLGSMLE